MVTKSKKLSKPDMWMKQPVWMTWHCVCAERSAILLTWRAGQITFFWSHNRWASGVTADECNWTMGYRPCRLGTTGRADWNKTCSGPVLSNTVQWGRVAQTQCKHTARRRQGNTSCQIVSVFKGLYVYTIMYLGKS